MKKKKVVPIALLSFLVIGQVKAQSVVPKDTTFKPSGKVELKVYADYHATFSKVNDENGNAQNTSTSAFEITRAYFGYKYNFSKKWSGNVKLDVGKDDNLSAYTAYLKNAGLTWEATKKLAVNFGLIDTREFNFQEGFWGKRYLYNSFQDKYHFGSSADAGIVLQYKFSELLKADVSILNGDGYKSLQDINGQYQYAGGLTITPVKGLYIRVYGDYYSIASTDSGRNANKTTLATFIGYKSKAFDIGAEYNLQNNFQSLKKHNLSGASVYGEYWLNKKIGIFARYDYLTSNKINATDKNDWNFGSGNIGNDGSAIIAGVEAKPIEGVSLSLNYQGWQPSASDAFSINSIYFSVQYAF